MVAQDYKMFSAAAAVLADPLTSQARPTGSCNVIMVALNRGI